MLDVSCAKKIEKNISCNLCGLLKNIDHEKIIIKKIV